MPEEGSKKIYMAEESVGQDHNVKREPSPILDRGIRKGTTVDTSPGKRRRAIPGRKHLKNSKAKI